MNPGDLIFGLNHIGLFEPDVEAAADFYRQMFGFETRSVNLDASGKPHIIFLEQRGLVLELLQIDEDPSEWMKAAQATPNHVALCCSDTKKMVALLKARGRDLRDGMRQARHKLRPGGLRYRHHIPARPRRRADRDLPGDPRDVDAPGQELASG